MITHTCPWVLGMHLICRNLAYSLSKLYNIVGLFSVHKGDTPCFRIINKKIIHLLHSVDSNITLSTSICFFALSLSLRSSSAEFRVYCFIEAHTKKTQRRFIIQEQFHFSSFPRRIILYIFSYLFLLFCAHTRVCVF